MRVTDDMKAEYDRFIDDVMSSLRAQHREIDNPLASRIDSETNYWQAKSRVE